MPSSVRNPLGGPSLPLPSRGHLRPGGPLQFACPRPFLLAPATGLTYSGAVCAQLWYALRVAECGGRRTASQPVREEGFTMSFTDYLKKALEIVKLNKEVIGEMAVDEKALGPAVGVVAISGVCWAIGALQPLGIIYGPIIRLIGFFIFTGIVHFVAVTFLGGEGDFKGFMNPVGLAVMVTWVSIIPLLGVVFGVLAGLWVLVPAVLTAEHVYKIDRGKAVIAVVAPIVVFMILGGIFALIGLSMWAVLGN
ncbi:MAG: hypothetical protein GF400_04785 [Candidatus Eisenbacteria bacterium]|nr:hypothetical protein [Candidatus Eisenbacteria bacterium]